MLSRSTMLVDGRLRPFVVAVALMFVSLCEQAAAVDLGRKLMFDIRAQKLVTALLQFSHQSGVQVVVGPEVGEQTTAGINGEQSIANALAHLLEPSGLSYVLVGENSISVGKSNVATPSAGSSPVAPNDMRLAQTAEQPKVLQSADQQSSQSAAGVSETKLDEIVVTATKRLERLQDVPMSIAVVTGEEIDRRGMVLAEDYLRGMPGVTSVNDQSPVIIIRGLETSTGGQNWAGGTTVATYFGETPTSSSGGLGHNAQVDVAVMDIERVEVLRGPQGTAFGNSSLGGAVRIIPVAPKLGRIEGKVSAGYSATAGAGGDNHQIQAVGNVPLIGDKLALRATAYKHERSGFYRNVAGSDPALQAAMAPFGAQSFAVNQEQVGDTTLTGGRIAALFQASDALKFTLSFLTQKNETDGLPGEFRSSPVAGPYEQIYPRVAPAHALRGQENGFQDANIDLGNALLEYDLGWANLLASYSHISSGSTYALPLMHFGLGPTSVLATSEHRAHIGEIRMTTQLEGAWNFLGGLYAEDLDDEHSTLGAWYGTPESNYWAPNQTGASGMGGAQTARKLKQKAVFAEASWKLLPRVTLTGGVRYYDYDRGNKDLYEGFYFGSVNESVSSQASDSNFRANLSYKPNDNALVYADWSQGFRLGRGQAGLPATCDVDNDGIIDGTNISRASTREVQSDSVDNYGVGGKFTLLDRRLAVAADIYRIDWFGVPVFFDVQHAGGPGQDTGCLPFYTANAGSARSEGFELQTNFHVTDAFRLDIGGSWIHATLTEHLPTLNASAGSRLPGSPEYNANVGLQYEFEIAGSKAFARADTIYVGDIYNGLTEAPLDRSDDYLKVDASVRVLFKQFNIDLFVRNLTNEEAYLGRGGGIFGTRLRPRTIGFQLAYDF